MHSCTKISPMKDKLIGKSFLVKLVVSSSFYSGGEGSSPPPLMYTILTPKKKDSLISAPIKDTDISSILGPLFATHSKVEPKTYLE